jgi:hypothetical protein
MHPFGALVATMRLSLHAVILSVLWAGCSSMTHGNTSSNLDTLAARLASSQVAEMATGLGDDPHVDAIWKEFPDPDLYASLVADGHRAAPVRFGAAVVLFAMRRERLFQIEPRAVADVFASALQHDLAGYAYPWGRLWASPDPVGYLGQVFVRIGRPALRALEALLDDATPRDTYLGSEEATEMAQRRYRVKDFAAVYIAQILKLELPWEPELARRDAAIARLRQAIPRPGH